jgi:asparagine synthase (glutamine-hydrolysing)
MGCMDLPGDRGRADVGCSGSDIVHRADGRPLVVGRWPADQAIVVADGAVTAAFLGTTRFGRARAQDALGRAVGGGSFAVLAQLPGCFHVVVATPTDTYVYGDVAGLRRVFYAAIDDRPCFSDHAIVLRRQLDAAVDDHWLAMWLACPGHRHIFDSRTPFEGVRLVPPGSGLRIGQNGTVTTHAYWRPPVDDQPLAEAAPVLRSQLTDAVAARVAPLERVSCDFSGGLDSTTLAFLAAAGLGPDGSLLALTQPARSPTNDDPVWAARAAAALPASARQLVIDEAAWPFPYGEVDPAPLLDEPAPAYSIMSWLRFSADVQRAHDCQMHFSGHGGDQVLLPPIAYLARTLRTEPRAALAQFRGTLALHRGISASVFARMLHPPSYQAWLAMAATGVADPSRSPPPSWGEPPRTPAWLSRTARDLVGEVLSSAARDLDPLSPFPGQHAALDRIREVAGAQRSSRDALMGLGVRLELPFFDGDVIETCLATKSHERAEPTLVKPLLLRAMEGLVPGEVLGRITKASYQTDFCLGWRRHHGAVQALFEESRLEARGLVDGDQVRAAFRPTLVLDFLRLAALNGTLVAELWLRALERDQAALAPAESQASASAGAASGAAGFNR